MVALPRWTGRVWASVAAVAVIVSGIVGFLSASTDLWKVVTGPKNDTDVMMLPNAKDTIVFDLRHPPEKLPKVLKAGTIVVDGISLALPDDTLVFANKLDMRGGASVKGRRISVVATIIEGGSIIASGSDGAPGRIVPPPEMKPTGGTDGGDVLVAAASIAGTPVRADGGQGGDGAPGAVGAEWPRAANGKNGNCAGFGGYIGNSDGEPGRDGHSGGPGQDGAPGGNGGNLVLLIPKAFSPPPATASKGPGGAGGKGGSGGAGQLGGLGGSGCTGLGGSQGRARDGTDGQPGPPGKDGKQGGGGLEGTIVIRHIVFQKVESAWNASDGDEEKFIRAIRALLPD